MALIERVTARLIESDTGLERPALLDAARRVLEEEAPLAPPSTAGAAVDALIGLGPLEELLRDPEVSDVLVNGPNEVFVERGGTLQLVPVAFADGDAVVAAVERVIAPLGLRLDRASPAVAARLADGSRLHAVVPPIAVDGPVVAIRRFTEAMPDLEAMVAAGAMAEEVAGLLADAVVARRNILVAGGTGSGKTTLLNVLSKRIPSGERVVTIEDAAELRLSGHVVRLEARPANAEGAGEVTLQALVRHALRLRPDRIIVGEARGPEALDMVQAMSTGHDGSMSTIHASSPGEALLRVETLALSGDARLSPDVLRRQLHSAVDLVVQVERRGGRRRLVALAAVAQGGAEMIGEW